MKKLNVYLTFPGNCKQALDFYKECLGCESLNVQTFGQAPMESKEEDKEKIMHAEFRSDEIYFMASDSSDEHPVTPGNNVSLSINMTDEQEQTAIFEKLSAGGQVIMPLEDTFWGARFGMLVDRFGINWLLNCEKTNQ